ncbi:MAG: fused MFS/spermidine synthase [Candidatus Schekmanbacteria bacterium]|nr:fused MFS/spermidine synthase [Candidatus Schekmanbacteria bacterium]
MKKNSKHSIGFIYLTSGFAALVYEVIWLRLFGLKFGISSLAVGTVLAAFMLGLAWGANFWGRYVAKKPTSNPLMLYAFLELGVGLYGLLLPYLLEFADNQFLQIIKSSQPGFATLSLGRFFLAMLLLFPPTALMGGTLPVLSRLVKIEDEIGYLYGVNILGAVLGCLVSGFFLIGNWGVQNTNFLAAGINIFIALLVLLGRTTLLPEHCPHPDHPPSRGREEVPILSPTWRFLLLLTTVCAGFTSLSYEVLWNRILALMLRNTVYAFCTMLATFLTGLFIGSAISRRLIKNKSPQQVLGLLQLGIGLYALAIIPVFGKLNEIFCLWEIERGIFGHSWALFSLGQFALCAIVLLLPTVLMGAVFPLLCKLYLSGTDELNAAAEIGRVYALNTLGAVLGSLSAGFFLVPRLGSQGSIILTAGINIALGILIIALIWRHFPPSSEWIAIMSVLMIFAAWGISRDMTFRQAIEDAGEEILYRREDSGSLIEVTRHKQTGTRMLVTNRQQQEGDSSWPSVYNQREQVYLPLLLHPQPKKVLGIGLGTGISIAALTHYPLELAECVELSPGVIFANRFFAPENDRLLQNPRLKIIQADGRNYLRLTPYKYDLIIADLFTSYQAGVGNLYSREHYLQCRERLAPGGIMCQWLPPHQLPGSSLKIIARTFQSVFPHTSVWLTRQAIALIATDEPLKIDYQRFKSQFNLKDLHAVGLGEPLTFLNNFIMGEQRLAGFTAGQPINTDDYPLIEFETPKEFYRLIDTSLYDQHVAEISQYQESIITYVVNWGDKDLPRALERNWQAQIHARRGEELMSQEDYPAALKEFRQALDLDRNQIGARKSLEKYYLFQGQELSKSGLWREALAEYQKAAQIAPRSAQAHLGLGQIYQQLQDVEKAKREFSLVLQLDPYHPQPGQVY